MDSPLAFRGLLGDGKCTLPLYRYLSFRDIKEKESYKAF